MTCLFALAMVMVVLIEIRPIIQRFRIMPQHAAMPASMVSKQGVCHEHRLLFDCLFQPGRLLRKTLPEIPCPGLRTNFLLDRIASRWLARGVPLMLGLQQGCDKMWSEMVKPVSEKQALLG